MPKGSRYTEEQITFALRQAPCKHVIAAKRVEEREGKRHAPPIDTDTPPAKKTHGQNWRAHNLAQTAEKRRLQVLLADLCAGVPQPPPVRKEGRKPVPVADRLTDYGKTLRPIADLLCAWGKKHQRRVAGGGGGGRGGVAVPAAGRITDSPTPAASGVRGVGGEGAGECDREAGPTRWPNRDRQTGRRGRG